MIRFAQSRRRIAILEMTPLVDVVFLMLLFFLLTSSSIQHSMELNLPETRSGALQPAKPIVVAIAPDRSLRLDEAPVALGGLAAALAERFAGGAKRSISIESDETVPFGLFAQVLDEAKQAGAEEISLATEILYDTAR